MTDTQAPEQMSEQESVTITPRMRDILQHMLDNGGRTKHYAASVAKAIGSYSGTVTPLMRRMESYGWLVAEEETPKQKTARSAGAPATARGGPSRVHFRFTPGSAAKLRRALR